MESWKFLLRALFIAAFLELLANRVFSRLAMHIPKASLDQALSSLLFASLSSLGVIAYYVSYALACGLLVSLVYQKLKARETLAGVFSFLVFFILISDFLSQLVRPSMAFASFYDLASITTLWMFACSGFAKSGPKGHKLPLFCLAVSYTCYYYFKTSQAAAGILGMTEVPPWVIQAFAVGELLAVINSLFLFLAYSSASAQGEVIRPGGLTNLGRSLVRKKRRWILPTVLAMSFLLARLLDPYMLSLVATWSLGWTLYLPAPLYAIAIWLFSYTVLENIRIRPYVGYGLGLIFIAGYGISLSYQVLDAILGISCLSWDPEEA
ncbi:MAG: hypothetical protein ACE5HC_10535 [Candidatus Binatia bacterium]